MTGIYWPSCNGVHQKSEYHPRFCHACGCYQFNLTLTACRRFPNLLQHCRQEYVCVYGGYFVATYPIEYLQPSTLLDVASSLPPLLAGPATFSDKRRKLQASVFCPILLMTSGQQIIYNLGGKRRQLQQGAKQTVVKKKPPRLERCSKPQPPSSTATVTTLLASAACYLRFHML